MATENDAILRQCFINDFVLPPLLKDLPLPIKAYIKYVTCFTENRGRQASLVP